MWAVNLGKRCAANGTAAGTSRPSESVFSNASAKPVHARRRVRGLGPRRRFVPNGGVVVTPFGGEAFWLHNEVRTPLYSVCGITVGRSQRPQSRPRRRCHRSSRTARAFRGALNFHGEFWSHLSAGRTTKCGRCGRRAPRCRVSRLAAHSRKRECTWRRRAPAFRLASPAPAWRRPLLGRRAPAFGLETV